MSKTINNPLKLQTHTANRFQSLPAIMVGLLCSLLVACNGLTSPLATATPTPPPFAERLVFYDWELDIPQSILDAFSEEFGVNVTYLTYETQEEAVQNMRAGEVYDVVVVENQFVLGLAAEGLLAELDYDNVPNFEHIAPNFKDLAYDPHNRYSIPYSWGTSGLIVRGDLAGGPITRWADLWNPAYAGQVALRSSSREIVGLTLKSLGFSANSEDPTELEAALERLLELPKIVMVGGYAEDALPVLASGEAVILVGWAEDVWTAQEEKLEISYVLPEEGPLLWGDNFVIPANSPHQATAELFLNFLLRPEISAQITNENYYASPNEAARSFIEPEILNDPIIFPSSAELKNAEVLLPLSPEGEQRYLDIWERFLAANQ